MLVDYGGRAVSRDCPNDSAAWKVEFYPHMRLGLTLKRPVPCLAPGVLRKCQFERRVVMTMKSRTVAVAAVSVCAISAGAIFAGAVRETLPRPRRVLAKPMGLSSTLHATLNGKSNAIQLRFIDTHFGGLDVLVNSAGVGVFRPVSELSIQDWQDTIDTNPSGVFYCCREALFRYETRGGGHIVNK